jgi:NADH pyrophosphatase NudC (nudix superfamily)
MTYNFCPDCGSQCLQVDAKTFNCAKCGHNFYDDPVPSAAAMIKNAQGKYLFIRRNEEPGKGSVAVPGGCVDCGESLEECCIRECFEEAGVNITNLKYFASYPDKAVRNGQDEISVCAFFTAETIDAGLSDNYEVSEIFWLLKEEIDVNQMVLKDVKAFIVDFLKTV